MGLKERLVLITNELNLSGRAFEKECGLTTGAFAGFGDRIGADILKKISIRYPQFSTRWILTGEGEMLTENDETNQTKSDMTQKFFEELEQRNKQFNELLEQNSRLISVIENMTGTTFKQSKVG